jgi:hypothetical protein
MPVEAITILFLWLPLGSLDQPVSLDDLRVFPSRADAIMVTARTWSIYCDYDRVPPLFSREEYDWWYGMKNDAYCRWYVWDDLRLAYDESSPLQTRLCVLRRLRSWIGHNAYGNGGMPSCVPP